MAIYDTLGDLSTNELVLRGFFGLGIIIAGIIFGKLISFGLRKISEKTHLSNHVKSSFIDLFLFIIRWSIYLSFVNLGINQLGIPAITNYFSNILIAIPSFTGGLLLLVVGFGLAYYLREIIKTTEKSGWKFLSELVFFFVLIIFGVYAARTALIPMGDLARDYIAIIITTILTTGAVYYFIKKSLTNKD